MQIGKDSDMAEYELDCNYSKDEINPINAGAAFFKRIKINGNDNRVLIDNDANLGPRPLCNEQGGYKYSLICHESSHQTTHSIVSGSGQDILLVVAICVIVLLVMLLFCVQYKRRTEQNAAVKRVRELEEKLQITEKGFDGAPENV